MCVLRTWLWFALAAGTAPALGQAHVSSPTSAAISSATDAENRCIDCHASIVQSYARSRMAHALGPIEAGAFANLEAVPDAHTGIRYRFAEDASGPRIIETWTSPPSEASSVPNIELAYPLAFAIGAGHLDRSFAARSGELLFFAPLEVVRRGDARRATLAPGNMIRPGARLSTPITEECIACHTSDPIPRDYPLNLAPRSPTWQPRGISCAGCHGAADAHAAWRERDLSGEKQAAPDPLLAAKPKSAVESVSLCARCHLQGDARILLDSSARGIPPPGGDLLERAAVFVAEKPTNDIGFVSQVERMVLSRCFTRSIDKGARAMTCVTCHDPHRSMTDSTVQSAVRASCGKCHEDDGSAASHSPAASPPPSKTRGCSLAPERRAHQDCASCHMRRSTTFDVAEVEIHDHFIQRTFPPPAPPKPLRTKECADGKLALFTWPGAKSPAYAADSGLWMMAFMSLGRADLALPFAAREPGDAAKHLAMYHHLRGSLLEQSSQNEEARRAYERALAIDPMQAETAVNLSLLLGQLGRPEQGVQLLDRVIAAHPKAEGALRNRATLKLALHDTPGFAADLEAAQAIFPVAAVARVLSQYYRELGRGDIAQRWHEEALRLDPAVH
jgi:predicted CXXCH cytochrome family protein